MNVNRMLFHPYIHQLRITISTAILLNNTVGLESLQSREGKACRCCRRAGVITAVPFVVLTIEKTLINGGCTPDAVTVHLPELLGR